MEQEITINQTKYFSEEKYTKDLQEIKQKLIELENQTRPEKKKVLRFSELFTLKLIKKLSAIFPIRENSVSEDYLIKQDYNVIDPANVCKVMPKSEEAKRLLSMFVDYDNDKPEPKLDFNPDKVEPQQVKLSLDYIIKILDILNVTQGGFKITVKTDYPTCIENKHFKFILAPRICDDEFGNMEKHGN